MNITGNGSDTLVLGPKWSTTAITNSVLVVLAGIMNVTVLVAFLATPSLRTPFNILLENLLITNLCHMLLMKPFDIVVSLFSRWIFSVSACSYYIFTHLIFNAAIINSHALISLDRLWAVAFPMSYRKYHTVRFAIGLCFGMWAYVMAGLLPEFVIDWVMYRRHISTGCAMNNTEQQVVIRIMTLVMFVLPEIVLLGAFPLTMYKRILFLKNRQKVTHNDGVVPVKEQQPKPEKERSHAFLVLTLLTASVFVLWTPLTVLFIVGYFVKLQSYVYFDVAGVLFSLETVMDPALFTLAMGPLQKALSRFQPRF